jgi:hypothetical protein
MILFRYLDLPGAAAVEWNLRAGRVSALDEIVAAFGIRRACSAPLLAPVVVRRPTDDRQ